MSDDRHIDVEAMESRNGLNRFELVHVVRQRANEIAAGAPARLPLPRQNPVSTAMREVVRGKVPTYQRRSRAHVLNPFSHVCEGCGATEGAIVAGQAPPRCA